MYFQNEVLQETVAQRAQMFETLSGSEREQLAQYQILKETLDSVSQELAQKHAQVGNAGSYLKHRLIEIWMKCL